jgi:hypothetical protein
MNLQLIGLIEVTVIDVDHAGNPNPGCLTEFLSKGKLRAGEVKIGILEIFFGMSTIAASVDGQAVDKDAVSFLLRPAW